MVITGIPNVGERYKRNRAREEPGSEGGDCVIGTSTAFLPQHHIL